MKTLVDKLLGTFADPYAETYFQQLQRIKTTGLKFSINVELDMFDGLTFRQTKDSNIKMSTLQSMLNMYFEMNGRFRNAYYFPLLAKDKIKVIVNFNGYDMKPVEGTAKSIKFSKEDKAWLNKHCSKKTLIHVTVIMTKAHKDREKLEDEYFLHDPEQYRQELMSQVPLEHKSTAVAIQDNYSLQRFVQGKFSPLNAEMVKNNLNNFEVVKSCLVKPESNVHYSGYKE